MAATTQALNWVRYVEEGLPDPAADFALVEVPAPSAGTPPDGHLLLDLLYVSVDPYMRGRMRNQPGYFVGPFEPGQPLSGIVVAHVKASAAPDVAEGDVVVGFLPWQQLQLAPRAAVTVVPGSKALLADLKAPASLLLGAMGMVGMTAYCSLKEIGKPKAGETVFVSGAAGAVGLLVGQLCKHVHGCRVVGSAGSDEKVALLVSQYGYDAAFNYKTTPVKEGLAKHCPNGIDVYFDNVGGETLEAVLHVANPHARVVACGSISGYNTANPYGVTNLFNIVTKRILMQGFIAGDFVKAGLQPVFWEDMARYLREGKVKNVEHVFTGGLAAAGRAFVDMMSGVNIGKAVVACAADPFRNA